MLRDWMPELDGTKAEHVCKLLDRDGDGYIDFDEFAKAVSQTGDDMRGSTAGLVARREKEALSKMVSGRGGRFGATPTTKYGVQMRELFTSFPGSAQCVSGRFHLRPLARPHLHMMARASA